MPGALSVPPTISNRVLRASQQASDTAPNPISEAAFLDQPS